MESLEGVGRMDNIPGLSYPESKKGKKKAPNKNKTLSLQNFLQDENQESDSEEKSETEIFNSSLMGNLKLSEEERAVMESCHSFIHDLLKQLGPSNAGDPILQTEINNFPPEAKNVIHKCGGYRSFILLSKDLVVVDKMLCARSDLIAAQNSALQGFSTMQHNGSYSNVSINESYDAPRAPNHNQPPPRNALIDTSKPPNLPPQKHVKDIWNSKQNSGVWNQNNAQREVQVDSSGGIWGNNSNHQNSSGSFPLQLPRYEGSLFNDGIHSDSLAKTYPPPSIKSNKPTNNRESDFPIEDNEPHSLLGGLGPSSGFSSSFGSKGGSSALSDLAKNGTSDKKSPDDSNGESAAQKLMKGFCSEGLFSSPEYWKSDDLSSGPNRQWEEMHNLSEQTSQQGKIIEDFQDRVWKLTSHNNDLLKQLADKEQDVDKLSRDLVDLKAKYADLDSKHQRMSAEMGALNSENQTLKAQVSLRPESESSSQSTNGEVQSNGSPELKTNTDREVIWSLQKQLEMEQLRTRNLTQELQIQRDEAMRKSHPPGLINHPRSLTRQAGSVPMLGLGAPGLDEDPFGLRRMMQNGPMNNGSMPPISRQSSMFGPLVGPEFVPSANPINKSGAGMVWTPSGFVPAAHPIDKSDSSIGLTGLSLASEEERVTTGNRSSHTPSPAGSTSPPAPSLTFPSSFNPAPSYPNSAFSSAPSFPGPAHQSNPSFAPPFCSFSQPPPAPQAAIGTTAPTAPPTAAVPPPAAQTTGTGGSVPSVPQNTKIAREQQLVKKLVGAIPGSNEDKVRQYIQVLRSKSKNGKLSGLATSEIAVQISELMKNENQ